MDIKSNEVVIIAGKGHEIYQEYALKSTFQIRIVSKNILKRKIKP